MGVGFLMEWISLFVLIQHRADHVPMVKAISSIDGSCEVAMVKGRASL